MFLYQNSKKTDFDSEICCRGFNKRQSTSKLTGCEDGFNGWFDYLGISVSHNKVLFK